MNPFQKAEQASREAAERRRRGNAARANAWSGKRDRERRQKRAEEERRQKQREEERRRYKPKTPPRPRTSSRSGPTPRYSARPGPTPRTSRAGPTPRTRRKTHTPIFEENNQGYTYNFEPETPPPKNTRSNYQKALNYFGYMNLNGKTNKNVKKNYLKMARSKHPNKGGNTANFQLLRKYYNLLTESIL